MDLHGLSRTYRTQRLTEAQLDPLYALCQGNPLYYQHCPPPLSKEGLYADLTALPPGKGPEDKHYLGFFRGERLAAVMDLIVDFPQRGTAFIGFFMVDAALQGRGTGSAIIREAEAYWKEQGFSRVRLGYAQTNPQSRAFWEKNGYAPTGAKSDMGAYTVVIMEKTL